MNKLKEFELCQQGQTGKYIAICEGRQIGLVKLISVDTGLAYSYETIFRGNSWRADSLYDAKEGLREKFAEDIKTILQP